MVKCIDSNVNVLHLKTGKHAEQLFCFLYLYLCVSVRFYIYLLVFIDFVFFLLFVNGSDG